MVAFAIKVTQTRSVDNVLAIGIYVLRPQDTKRGIWRAPGLDTLANERISYSSPKKTPIHVIQRPIQEKRSRFCKCSMDDSLPNTGKHSYCSTLSHRRARTE